MCELWFRIITAGSVLGRRVVKRVSRPVQQLLCRRFPKFMTYICPEEHVMLPNYIC